MGVACHETRPTWEVLEPIYTAPGCNKPRLCSTLPYHLSLCVLFGLDALSVVLELECTRLLADGLCDLTNRVDNELVLLFVYVMATMCVRNVPNAIVVIGVLRSRAIRSARSARLSRVRYRVRRCLLRRWEGPCIILSLQPTPGEEKDRCHERKGTQHHQHRENRERHGPLPLLLARCQKA